MPFIYEKTTIQTGQSGLVFKVVEGFESEGENGLVGPRFCELDLMIRP